MNVLKAIKAAYQKVDRRYKMMYNAVFYSCQRVSRLSSEMHDRPLGPGERLKLWAHLRMCSWCRRYQRQLQFLKKQVDHYAESYPEQSSAAFSDDAKKRILKKISDPPENSL